MKNLVLEMKCMVFDGVKELGFVVGGLMRR